MAVAASAIAAGVSGVFTVMLLRRYAAGGRSRSALLHWGVALAMFCLASAILLLGELVGWGGASFRAFYLFGAVLNVPWLALGSVHVNADVRGVDRAVGVAAFVVGALFLPAAAAGEPLAVPGAVLGIVWGLLHVAMSGDALRTASTVLIAVWATTAAFVVLSAALEAPVPVDALPEGRDLFAPGVRGFAVGGNALGSIIVIVGAAASSAALAWGSTRPDARAAFRQRLRRAPLEALAEVIVQGARGAKARGLGHVAVGNLLIALGVLLAASGGAFSFLGATVGHAVALAVGVAVMFLGFVRTTRRYGPADRSE